MLRGGIFVVYRCLSTSSQLQLGKPSLRLSGWPVVRQRVMALAIEIHADRHTGGVSLSLWGESDWLTKYDWAPGVFAHLEWAEWWEGKADLWGVAKGKNAKTQCACLCVMICVLRSLRFCGCEGNCAIVKGEDREASVGRSFIYQFFLKNIAIYSLKKCTWSYLRVLLFYYWVSTNNRGHVLSEILSQWTQFTAIWWPQKVNDIRKLQGTIGENNAGLARWTTNDLVAKMIEGYQGNQSLKYPQASHLQSNGWWANHFQCYLSF